MRSRQLLAACVAAVALITAAVPTAALESCQLDPGQHERSLVHGGRARYYVLHVPPGCDAASPLPLLFDFHGSGIPASEHAQQSGFRTKADIEGFVVVHPTGVDLRWNAFDGLGEGASTEDDVGFVRAMAEAIDQELPVDSTRIYATGHSMGAALTHRLACEAADLIAAAVPVSCSLTGRWIGCSPARPVGVLQFHGLSDPNVPYEGAPDTTVGPILAAPESAATWGEVNDCSAVPQRTLLAGESYCDLYQGCAGSVEEGLCTIRGGHFIYQHNDDDIVIRDVAWVFLSGHTLVPEPRAVYLELAALAMLGALRLRRAGCETRAP